MKDKKKCYRRKVPEDRMVELYEYLMEKRNDPVYWQNYLDWLADKAAKDPAYLGDYADAILM